MLKAPEAIMAAIAGLVGFAVAASAAMIIMALGMAQAVVILIPFAVAMSIVSVPLAKFAGAMAIAAGAFYLLAVGLERLGESLQAFGKVGFDDMQKAAVALFRLYTSYDSIGSTVGCYWDSCRTSSNGNRGRASIICRRLGCIQ